MYVLCVVYRVSMFEDYIYFHDGVAYYMCLCTFHVEAHSKHTAQSIVGKLLYLYFEQRGSI